MDSWVVHGALEDTEAGDSSDQFYITEMAAPLKKNAVSHSENEDVYADGFFFSTLTHTVTVEFEEK